MRLVGAYQICNRYQESMQQAPLMSHIALIRPWEKVGVNVFTFADRNYLLTLDYLSRFCQVDRLPSKTATDSTCCLRQHFSRHGPTGGGNDRQLSLVLCRVRPVC